MERDPFEYQKPDEDQILRIQNVREGCRRLHEALLLNLPYCRERSVAITNLEQVSMWANKGIVFNGPPVTSPPPELPRRPPA